MIATRARRALGPLAAVALLAAGTAAGGCGSAAVSVADPADADRQLQFGARMATRGLWSEALFRFQRADRLSPGNPRVLNNLAVAYEAAGRYEDALATYRRALEISPGNSQLRENYARFVDFYESFRPAEEGAGELEGLP